MATVSFIGGRIRNASPLDAPELSRLIATSSQHVIATPLSVADVVAWLEGGHLLVLDLGAGTLGAVAHVIARGDDATLDLLVVDPSLAATDIERRMYGVAHALCEAYGCSRFDTVADRRVASPGRR